MSSTHRLAVALATRLAAAPGPSALALLALALLLTLACPGRLQAADEAMPEAAPVALGEPRAKIDSLIRAFIDLPVTDQGIDARLRRLTVPARRLDLLRVRLDVVVTAESLAAIAATGAQTISSAPRWNVVVVEATLAQIDALARLPAVQLVAPALRPRHHGSGSTQPGTYVDGSAAVIHTDQLRTTFGVDGNGRTIGIISDSINVTAAVGSGTVTGSAPQTLTGTAPQNSGDLPASILLCDNSNPGGSTDEGEAMMEGAYHLAPGAAFAFAPCGQVDTDMATNIGLLKSQAGCSVICDDIIFLDEPMFQDGPIAQAADAFVQAGGIYLTAAGNNANYGILATYTPFTANPDPHTNGKPNGNTFHNWGINGATPDFLPLTIPAGGVNGLTVDIILEWNQPYHSYGLGSGAASDFNLYLYKNANLTHLLASKTNVQGTAAAPSGDPNEILSWTNNGGATTVYLAVDYRNGVSANQLFRVVVLADGPPITSPGNTLLSFGTSYGHQTVSSVLTIAATDVSISPQLVEYFSSFGGYGGAGLPYYFGPTGTPLSGAPQLRSKPDLTAPDGVTVFNTGFAPAFYGTSDATPHAAAAAALAWCAQPTLSNTQVIASLRAAAAPMALRATPSGGTAAIGAAPNGWCGYGLINAASAVGSTITSVCALTTSDANGLYASGTIPIQVTFTSPVTVSGTPVFALNTSPARNASYQSGSGTATLAFAYAIQPGDTAAALDAGSGAALTGGTISSTAAPPSLALPAAGTVGSLTFGAAIQIDARISQTITFPAIANQTYGAGPLPLSATVSSGLAPVFSRISGPAAVSGSALTITGVGTITVAADQPGDATHFAAAQQTRTFTVAPAAAAINPLGTTSVVYTGAPHAVAASASGAASPSASVTYQPWSGDPAVGGTIASGSVTASAPLHVGWYQLVASLDANHVGATAVGGLHITPAVLTVSAVNQSIVYGIAPATLGTVIAPFLGSDTSLVVSGAPVLACAAGAGSAVGSYPITVAVGTLSAADYTFATANGTVLISAAAATISPLGTTSMVYTGAPHAVAASASGTASPSASVTYQPWSGDPAVGGTISSGSVTANAPLHCGWYQVVATLDANHVGATASGGLHITPAALTVSAVSQSIIYGATPVAPSAVIAPFLGSDTSLVVSGAPVLACAAGAGSAVGSYPITVAQGTLSAADYTFATANGTVVISAAAATISPLGTTSVAYSGAPHAVAASASGAASPSASVTYQRWSGDPSVSGTNSSGSVTASAPLHCGWYQLVATLDANHVGATASGGLHITPATLTVSAVNQAVLVGTAPATPSAVIAPFLGSDTSAVVSGAPVLATTATAASPVGSYPITVAVGTLSAADYTFVAVNGTLVISPNPPSAQTITFASIGTPTVGTPVTLVASASSGLPVVFSVLSGPATVSGSNLLVSGAGTVVVAADQAGNPSYLAAAEVTQSITVAASGGGTSTGGPATAPPSSGGSGSHCGLGSGAAAALLVALMLCRLMPLRRRR